jgi:hypothetical protein
LFRQGVCRLKITSKFPRGSSLSSIGWCWVY